MEQNFQTSFIPKKPIVKERSISAQPIGILLITSLFILFTVLLVTGGLYFYKGVLKKDITDKDKSLILNQNAFESATITKYQVLDNRLKSSDEILSNHLAISPVFKALEGVTMKTVRYTKFGYELGTNEDSKITIKMNGVAIGYRSIALQSDLFTSNAITNKNFIDPIFSNLKLDNSGNVLFDLEFLVDPAFVNYKQVFLIQS